MGFKCGIIGLPNVGKSTLFNALTESNKAEAANYPFATIEPNVGRVAVPDERLYTLGKIGKSEKIIPSYMDFVDIAGLVEGASKGEGLGNKFLGHIREVDAIAHVVRCFNDENTTSSCALFFEPADGNPGRFNWSSRFGHESFTGLAGGQTAYPKSQECYLYFPVGRFGAA